MRQRIEQALGQGQSLAQAASLKAVVAGIQPFSPAHLSHQTRQAVQPADGSVGGARALMHGARMARCPGRRPVPAVPDQPTRLSPASHGWPPESRALAQELHALLRIDGRDWHAFKAQPQRRAAEQLAAALLQLLADANAPAAAVASPQRQQATALVENALGWLKGELRDPGCPSHGR